MTFDINIGKVDTKKLARLQQSRSYQENAYSSIVVYAEYNSIAPAVYNQFPPSYIPRETKHNRMNGLPYGVGNVSGIYTGFHQLLNLHEKVLFLRPGRWETTYDRETGIINTTLLYQAIRADLERVKTEENEFDKKWVTYFETFISFWWYYSLGKWKDSAVYQIQ